MRSFNKTRRSVVPPLLLISVSHALRFPFQFEYEINSSNSTLSGSETFNVKDIASKLTRCDAHRAHCLHDNLNRPAPRCLSLLEHPVLGRFDVEDYEVAGEVALSFGVIGCVCAGVGIFFGGIRAFQIDIARANIISVVFQFAAGTKDVHATYAHTESHLACLVSHLPFSP